MYFEDIFEKTLVHKKIFYLATMSFAGYNILKCWLINDNDDNPYPTYSK